jgi:PmbA protein
VDRSGRTGFASTTDLSPQGIASLARSAVAIAGSAPEDPDARLAAPSPAPLRDLDLHDPSVESLDFERGRGMAIEAERAALASDPRVGPGEGTLFAHSSGEVAIASTLGLAARYEGTRCLLSCTPVAEEAGRRERLSWFEGARHLSDLPPAESIGRRAGERAARMLGARRIATCKAPVVLDALEAGRFWAALISAFIGDAARRGASFLEGRLGERVASEAVTLVDDPLMPRAPGSRPFDGEGWPAMRLPLLKRGVLETFLYDHRTARRAGRATTGSAVRGYGTPPWPGAHAVRLEAGPHAPEDLLREARRGLYVTHMMGSGVNPVTGDYSRGAMGWWFEDGVVAYPVHEVTLSGNLLDLMKRVVMVGSDLVLRSSVASPTILIEEMVISGNS